MPAEPTDQPSGHRVGPAWRLRQAGCGGDQACPTPEEPGLDEIPAPGHLPQCGECSGEILIRPVPEIALKHQRDAG
jgi:hypothetical protein